MFSSIGTNDRWGVFEVSADGGSPRQLPLIPDADVDNDTSCYLPDDSILFTSTAPFIGVPCVRGASHLAHLYRYWPGTGRIRRLTFDQEHNWFEVPANQPISIQPLDEKGRAVALMRSGWKPAITAST